MEMNKGLYPCAKRIMNSTIEGAKEKKTPNELKNPINVADIQGLIDMRLSSQKYNSSNIPKVKHLNSTWNSHKSC